MSDRNKHPTPSLGDGARRQLMAVLDQAAPVDAYEAIDRASRSVVTSVARRRPPGDHVVVRRAITIFGVLVITAGVAIGLTVGLSESRHRSDTPTVSGDMFGKYLAAFNAQYARNQSSPPVRAALAQSPPAPPVSAEQALTAVVHSCDEGTGTRLVREALVRATFASGIVWAVFVDPPGQHLGVSTMPRARSEVLNWYVGFVAGQTGRVAFCSFGHSGQLPRLPVFQAPASPQLPPVCAGLGFSRLAPGTKSTITRQQALGDTHGLPAGAPRQSSFVGVSDPGYGPVRDGTVQPYFHDTPAWVVWVTGDFPLRDYYRGPPPGAGSTIVHMTVMAVVSPSSGDQELLATC